MCSTRVAPVNAARRRSIGIPAITCSASRCLLAASLRMIPAAALVVDRARTSYTPLEHEAVYCHLAL